MLLLLLVLSAADPAPVAPPPATAEAPPSPAPQKALLTTPLLKRFTGRLETRASSSWPGWGSDRLIDGDAGTSWFSAGGDAAALGKKPWVELRFPEAVVVSKVVVLGNRESSWPKGFSIHYGTLELFDEQGKLLLSMKNEERNLLADVEFRLKAPSAGVRAVRFTSLMDDGDKTQWRDIALAELLVE